MMRIVGLETEYGCLSDDPAGPASTVGLVRNWLFERQRYGLPDVFQRDWDEPPGNGGFLFNGGRAYVDMGHLEYCTPECLSLKDLLVYDRAGDLLVTEALDKLGLSARALTAQEASELRLRGGLAVESVDGAAARAGLQRGDVILAINNQPVTTIAEFRAQLQRSGNRFALLIQRGSARIFVPVRIE